MIRNTGMVDYSNGSLWLSANVSKLISTFSAVYESKSITKASICLKKTKSTISRDIAQLEYLCKKQLFVRNGCQGISPTQYADIFYFYAKQINDIYKIITEKFLHNIHDDKKINFCCHPLGAKYVISCIKRTKMNIEIFTDSKRDALNGLVSEKYDIILFPYDNQELASMDGILFYIKPIKSYNLCLFLNKCNNFANINENSITWNEVKSMNIVPLNRKAAFNFYLSVLSEKQNITSTTTFDLNLLKQGIDNDLWVACVGEEFYDFCDKKNTVVKKLVHAKNIFLESNWCVCCKNKYLSRVSNIIDDLKSH